MGSGFGVWGWVGVGVGVGSEAELGFRISVWVVASLVAMGLVSGYGWAGARGGTMGGSGMNSILGGGRSGVWVAAGVGLGLVWLVGLELGRDDGFYLGVWVGRGCDGP